VPCRYAGTVTTGILIRRNVHAYFANIVIWEHSRIAETLDLHNPKLHSAVKCHVITSRKKWWAVSRPDPYPEIGFGRTLSRVILEIIGSSGRDASLEEKCTEVYSASLRKGNRTVSVGVASDKRMFFASFSWKSIWGFSFTTADLHEVARAVELWLLDEMIPPEMERQLPGLSVSESAFETDPAKLVTIRWNEFLSSAPWLRLEAIALISAASKRPALRQLFPVLSIGAYLSFSRTIGYPFSRAGLCAVWLGKDRYGALGLDRKIVAEGTIEEVLDVIEQSLPSDTGPAILGAAADLNAE
jgi:Family of unknown function (DUF6193)